MPAQWLGTGADSGAARGDWARPVAPRVAAQHGGPGVVADVCVAFWMADLGQLQCRAGPGCRHPHPLVQAEDSEDSELLSMLR